MVRHIYVDRFDALLLIIRNTTKTHNSVWTDQLNDAYVRTCLKICIWLTFVFFTLFARITKVSVFLFLVIFNSKHGPSRDEGWKLKFKDMFAFFVDNSKFFHVLFV